MARRSSPTVRNRELGALLKSYREARNLTAAQVAKDVGLSPAVISRLETASRMSPRSGAPNVRALCSYYGLDPAVTERLVHLAKEGSRPGWWQRYDLESPTVTYLDLETAALTVDSFETWLAPGILQTRAYATEVLSLIRPQYSAVQMNEAVESRLQRGRFLTGEDPLVFHAVIDESVLHRIIGGREILREQLAHIKTVATGNPNVTVQILPLATGINWGVGGHFSVLSFAEKMLPSVAHSEGHLGQLFEDDPAEVERLQRTFARLASVALDPTESLRLIDERMHDLA